MQSFLGYENFFLVSSPARWDVSFDVLPSDCKPPFNLHCVPFQTGWEEELGRI